MSAEPRVLIVEDERALALAFAAAVRRAGASSSLAPTASQARRSLQEDGLYDAIILDIGLPDENGLDFLASLPERDRHPTLVVTAHGEINNTIQARKLGVCQFFTKPLNFEAFSNTLASILRAAQERMKPPLGGAFLGKASSMRPVFRQIAHACVSDEPVLLFGETGSGKTRVARLISEHTDCPTKPFVIHVAGMGDLEEDRSRAESGTLLIKEVADLSLTEQHLLLREIEIAQPGTPRFLATSTISPEEMKASGRLRPELYYRLQANKLRLPPLRNRSEDLPILVDYFIAELAPGRFVGSSPDFMERLSAHDWPGNLRELRNVISYALASSGGAPLLEPAHLPFYLEPHRREGQGLHAGVPENLLAGIREWLDDCFAGTEAPTYRELSETLESCLLHDLLPRFDGRLARLASELKANRATLRKRLRAPEEGT